MPPKVKKTYQTSKTKESEKEDENEIVKIISPKLRTLRQRNKKVNFLYNESMLISDNESRAQNENLKPLSFWSKKLKDLESKKTTTKERKHELYEFNESDDSFCPKKRKKRSNKKCEVKRKKQYGFENNVKKTFLKTKKLKEQVEFKKNCGREKLLINIEENTAIKKEQNCLHSSIITSTPATNKPNLIDTSNFLLISPLAKLNDFQDQQSIVDYKTPTKNELLKIKTPKKQSTIADLNNRRILRSRKIVD